MTTLHPFDQATALERREDGTRVGHTDPRYWNFAGPFGGLTAAILLRAVLEDPARAGVPVALTVNFCGMIAEGGFEIRTELVRGGRITQHWNATLRQGERVLATASAVCARRAETWAHHPAQMPAVPAPESIEPLDTSRRTAWMNAYDFRFVEGDLVLSRTFHEPLHSPRSVLWLADRPARPLDWLSLAALSDAFFPRVMHARGTATKMGTVTLTTYFHADEAELAAQGTAPLLGIADGDRFARSFQDQRVELWGREGHLLAVGAQVLWYDS